MVPSFSTVLQVLALLSISLVAGSVFGIWQGYDPATYGAATFLEVHQGAVRGLNTLLPALAIAALAMTAILAFLSRSRPPAFWLYVAAIVGIAIGGIVTRVFNQSINAEVMGWTIATMPQNWTAIRDSWWQWHIVRTIVTICCEMTLIAAVFADRASDATTAAPGD